MRDDQTESGEDAQPGNDSRRQFLRKLSYSAPAIVTLGVAAHSRKAGAQFPDPPSAPNTLSDPAEDEQLLNDLEEGERS